MKSFISFKLTIILFLSLLYTVKSINPISSNFYSADPACLVDNGTFYIYASHDSDSKKSEDGYFMSNWLLFSSTDMQNWVNYGIILTDTEFTWAQHNSIWRGQVIEKDEKYYYFVSIKGEEGSQIGVAVSDSPRGPFTDAIGKPLIEGKDEYLDPSVIVDDDGESYLYFGKSKLFYVKLNQDMISYSGKIQTVELTLKAFGGKTNYKEAPWIYKKEDTYYLVYACGEEDELPENICYSTSKTVTGPWEYKGEISLKQKKEKDTSELFRPSICDFKGKSYLVYHDVKLSEGNQYQRSVSVEEFDYKESDGSFPKISITEEGPEQIKLLDPFEQIPATTINYQEGIEIQRESGVPRIAGIQDGDHIKIKGVDFGEGATKFLAHIASKNDGGVIELFVDELDGESIGKCEIEGTGDWKKWKTVECDVEVSDEHDLFMVFSGEEEYLFDMDWWKFE